MIRWLPLGRPGNSIYTSGWKRDSREWLTLSAECRQIPDATILTVHGCFSATCPFSVWTGPSHPKLSKQQPWSTPLGKLDLAGYHFGAHQPGKVWPWTGLASVGRGWYKARLNGPCDCAHSGSTLDGFQINCIHGTYLLTPVNLRFKWNSAVQITSTSKGLLEAIFKKAYF